MSKVSAPAKKNTGRKILATNRKARHDYAIEETFEAGMALMGSEVKSIREGRVNLKDGFARFKNGELVLANVHISPYVQASVFNHEPLRERKLLMHKGEIKRLEGKTAEKGYTIVPLAIYSNERNKLKVELGLARGKLLHDKRHDIAEREAKREMERVHKYGGRMPD